MRPLALILLVSAAPALAFLAHVIHRSRQAKLSRRPLKLVGRVATVERALSPEGFVLVEGELWRARAVEAGPVAREMSKVRVVGASGCVLEVEPVFEVEPVG
jgi:membrane-bound serine protease (ClpP class)